MPLTQHSGNTEAGGLLSARPAWSTMLVQGSQGYRETPSRKYTKLKQQQKTLVLYYKSLNITIKWTVFISLKINLELWVHFKGR